MTVDARMWYLEELPNGDNFDIRIAHSVGSGFTPFGAMFPGSWTKSLCRMKYPGSDITVGQAFGDPCCRWKKGAKPDFTVWYTRDFPAESTDTCDMAKSLRRPF